MNFADIRYMQLTSSQPITYQVGFLIDQLSTQRQNHFHSNIYTNRPKCIDNLRSIHFRGLHFSKRLESMTPHLLPNRLCTITINRMMITLIAFPLNHRYLNTFIYVFVMARLVTCFLAKHRDTWRPKFDDTSCFLPGASCLD